MFTYWYQAHALALCHTLKINSIHCSMDRGAFTIFTCLVNGIALSGGWVPKDTEGVLQNVSLELSGATKFVTQISSFVTPNTLLLNNRVIVVTVVPHLDSGSFSVRYYSYTPEHIFAWLSLMKLLPKLYFF